MDAELGGLVDFMYWPDDLKTVEATLDITNRTEECKFEVSVKLARISDSGGHSRQYQDIHSHPVDFPCELASCW